MLHFHMKMHSAKALKCFSLPHSRLYLCPSWAESFQRADHISLFAYGTAHQGLLAKVIVNTALSFSRVSHSM